jgi:hypothetical protein
LLGAGCLARWQLDLDESVSSLTAALAIFRGLGHTWGVAETLNWLAVAHRRRGEADHATRLFEESLALYRDIAHEPGVAEVLLNLCLDAYYRGDAPRAAALGAQGLAIAERLGDLRTIVRARTQVGFAELRRGSVDEAADHFAAGMAAHRQAGYRWFAGHALVGLAGVLAARSRPRAAARLLGAVAALRAALPTPVPPDAYAEQPIEAAVRSQLPAADIAIARDEGAALTLEQAVAEAIRETAATG